jgi:hypothetical protein
MLDRLSGKTCVALVFTVDCREMECRSFEPERHAPIAFGDRDRLADQFGSAGLKPGVEINSPAAFQH